MRHLAFALPFVLLSGLPAQAQMITITPEQVGQIFCIGSLGNDMTPVEALLTPQLMDTVARAWASDIEFEAANPGEKPPLGDGLPWRTWQDYADTCVVGEIHIGSGLASVEIRYGFTEAPEANYSNKLLMIPVEIEKGLPEFWRIEDIDLGEGSTFRSALKAALSF